MSFFIKCCMVTHINSVVAHSIALFRCFMYEIIRVNMISIVLLLPFFQQFILYFTHCIYNVVVVC